MVGKMLVLPFTATFLGRENLGLEEQLRGEYAGILQWAVKGLQELLTVPQEERWPMPLKARGVARDFKVRSGPVAAFVETRLLEAPEGFVATERLVEEWRRFCEESGLRGAEAGSYGLLSKVKEECPFDVWRVRHPVTGVRGVRGLAFRAEFEEG